MKNFVLAHGHLTYNFVFMKLEIFKFLAVKKLLLHNIMKNSILAEVRGV